MRKIFVLVMLAVSMVFTTIATAVPASAASHYLYSRNCAAFDGHLSGYAQVYRWDNGTRFTYPEATPYYSYSRKFRPDPYWTYDYVTFDGGHRKDSMSPYYSWRPHTGKHRITFHWQGRLRLPGPDGFTTNYSCSFYVS